jgi:hypothetical protein
MGSGGTLGGRFRTSAGPVATKINEMRPRWLRRDTTRDHSGRIPLVLMQNGAAKVGKQSKPHPG